MRIGRLEDWKIGRLEDWKAGRLAGGSVTSCRYSINFCEIARGSLSELGSYIEFCQERRLLEPTDEAQLSEAYNHTWNTLGALLRSLKEKQLNGTWDRTYTAAKEDQELYDV
jgi:hypothetical protein